MKLEGEYVQNVFSYCRERENERGKVLNNIINNEAPDITYSGINGRQRYYMK